MTYDTFLRLEVLKQEAKNREVYCNATAHLENYLRAEYEERDVTPWDSSIVDYAVFTALGLLTGPIGAIAATGAGLNQAIADVTEMTPMLCAESGIWLDVALKQPVSEGLLMHRPFSQYASNLYG